MNKKLQYERMRTWKIPQIPIKVQATIQGNTLKLHIHHLFRGVIHELGFWENGEWFLRERAIYTEYQQKREAEISRIFRIVWKRYPARIGQLQRLTKIQKNSYE